MHSTSETPCYRAYLLRLWQIGADEAAVWRVLLEDPRTGERQGFTDLSSLVNFLNTVCRDADTNT